MLEISFYSKNNLAGGAKERKQELEGFELGVNLTARPVFLRRDLQLKSADFPGLFSMHSMRVPAFSPARAKSTSLCRLLVAGASAVVLSLGLSSAALADDLDTTDTWDGSSSISSWGDAGSATYSQTITVDSDTTIYGFSFELALIGGSTVQYQAYVYEWDSSTNTVVGNVLYVSDVQTAPDSSSFTTVTVNTGSTTLSAGKTYVIFLTTSIVSDQSGGYYIWGMSDDSYTDGVFVYLNNGVSGSPALAGTDGMPLLPCG